MKHLSINRKSQCYLYSQEDKQNRRRFTTNDKLKTNFTAIYRGEGF